MFNILIVFIKYIMDTINKLLGPLDKKYCNYFAILAICSFVLLLISLVVILATLFKMKFKDLTLFHLLQYLLLIVSTPLLYLLMYLQNRLLYQMCLK